MTENVLFLSVAPSCLPSGYRRHRNSNFNLRTLVVFSQNSEIKARTHISKPMFHELHNFLCIERMDSVGALGGTADYENKGRLK